MCVCVVCLCTYVFIYVCVYICVYENVYVCESVCMYAHSCVKVQTHTHHDACVAVRGQPLDPSSPLHLLGDGLSSACAPQAAGWELLHFPVSTSRPLVGRSMLGFLMLAPHHVT